MGDAFVYIRKNLSLLLILISVFLIGLLGTYFILQNNTNNKTKLTNKQIQETRELNVITGAPEVSEVKDNSYNFLLLGSGGSGHSGGSLTDSIIIVHVNPDTKKVKLISIPRDLYVPGNYKINASLINTNLSSFKGVVYNITGLPISYVISTDFSGITKIIDTLGGIDINMSKPYDDYLYPIKGLENDSCNFTPEKIAELHQKYSGFELEKQFTCRYEHVHIDSGINHVDGTLALKLARSRHGDSDFGRSQRQFAILSGIFKKLLTMDVVHKVDEIYDTFLSFVKTDIDINIANDLVKTFDDFSKYEISYINISDENTLVSSKSQNGAYILIPKEGENNFDGIKRYINSNITQ